MKFKKLLFLMLAAMLLGANDNNGQYCDVVKKITPGMNVLELFNLLGVPSNFSIPQNVDIEAIRGKNFNTKPTTNLNQKDNSQNLSTHPIFGAFNNVPDDQNNTLTWLFEKGTVTITVQLHGSKVFTVTDNLGCK